MKAVSGSTAETTILYVWNWASFEVIQGSQVRLLLNLALLGELHPITIRESRAIATDPGVSARGRRRSEFPLVVIFMDSQQRNTTVIAPQPGFL
jgi:hypothetical protein